MIAALDRPAEARAQTNAVDASMVPTAWRALGRVMDPEVPVVSIVELGIVRDVVFADGTLIVTLTPTYSGCPATDLIEGAVRAALCDAGVDDYRVEYRLAPAWTTDWLAPEARVRLRDYGIAPPGGPARIDVRGISPLRRASVPVPCPRCGSQHTALLSQFGSTACKAHYRCADCLEPFEYFKPH